MIVEIQKTQIFLCFLFTMSKMSASTSSSNPKPDRQVRRKVDAKHLWNASCSWKSCHRQHIVPSRHTWLDTTSGTFGLGTKLSVTKVKTYHLFREKAKNFLSREAQRDEIVHASEAVTVCTMAILKMTSMFSDMRNFV